MGTASEQCTVDIRFPAFGTLKNKCGWPASGAFSATIIAIVIAIVIVIIIIITTSTIV